MAHRCGFTQKVLTATLQASGFKSVASMSRGHPYFDFDLWAVGSKAELNEEEMKAQALALERNYKNVHNDVVVLESAGLLVREGRKLSAPWDELRASVSLTTA